MSNPEIGNSIRAAGLQTNYHDAGTGQAGKAPVVLIHGSGPGVSAWANWRLTIPALAERFRVIAPDIAGFGYTERPGDETGIYTLDYWLSHITGFLDALELDRVSLVGNSFGGALALALAIRHPGRVEKLVLMGAVGIEFDLTPGLDAVWGYEPSVANMKALMELFAFDRSLLNDDLAELRYQASIRPGVQESYRSMFPAPRQEGVNSLAQREQDIASITRPTLIVHGREDKVIPASNAIRFNELISDSQLHVYGRCGHWTQIEQADRFNRLVTDFLCEEISK
ncbi:alpha/beta hydrolase [Emcibacter sp.]|uniref:alpha/beta fold hydrolase n=1 Tax=Emcibacter sp. TaxID=1979954 RepID=UPI002AA90C0C|nr:alpha/beta hydrolase [Emcibacter sp.]